MDPYEALYKRRCRSLIGWFEPTEVELLGLDSVHEAIEKVNLIVQRLKTAQSRQKSYTDMKRRELEFSVGDKVFLKVSPMNGVMRFGKKGKLSPRFIGPMRLPDPSHVLNPEEIEFYEGLSYEEEPVQILDRQVRSLRTKDVASVKVLWRNYDTEEATWEAEEDTKKRYPHLFPTAAHHGRSENLRICYEPQAYQDQQASTGSEGSLWLRNATSFCLKKFSG
ncbi:uncharacterized protein LOC132045812 [Lycium ferocissimum]|uniref:uncharacterized protein LOC132045812 n=1 Tax=Lycium ferocissimum TaxID=112874 RepID=UPI00281623D6|nr:uncharacterized protein LOC132045812 [Lycium ferocissimum]